MFLFSYMDIPHHGSSNNNSSELFQIALAKKYGYSYNGEKYCDRNADCKSPMCNMKTINALKQAHKFKNVHADVYLTFSAWKHHQVQPLSDDHVKLNWLEDGNKFHQISL